MQQSAWTWPQLHARSNGRGGGRSRQRLRVDLKDVKEILEREVISVYDHRHLNLEVPEFQTVLPTTENIAVAIWKRLDGKIPNARLHRIRVYEMADLFADYYGEG